jgi:hypothetical protein
VVATVLTMVIHLAVADTVPPFLPDPGISASLCIRPWRKFCRKGREDASIKPSTSRDSGCFAGHRGSQGGRF